MVLAASTIECIGFGIYSAIFLRCGLLNIARPNTAALAQLMRAGPVLGISLGTAIFALIGAIWLAHGRFELGDHPGWGQLTIGILFALWVSNLIFEIWTLDPVRKQQSSLDGTSAPVARARRHLIGHCILVISLWMPWLSTLL